MIECRGFVRSFLSLRAGQTENAENRHPGREYPRGGDYFYFSSGLGAINRATRNYYFSEQQIISRDGLSKVQNVHYLLEKFACVFWMPNYHKTRPPSVEMAVIIL